MKPVTLVISMLCAGAAGLGLWLGSRPGLDEGRVIARYADVYATETGGAREECHGVPGHRADVWLIVLCEGAAGRFSYPVGFDGALLKTVGEGA